MVYLRMIPLGLCGGNQDTTTLLAEEGTALMPAGGPGSRSFKRKKGFSFFSPPGVQYPEERSLNGTTTRGV